MFNALGAASNLDPKISDGLTPGRTRRSKQLDAAGTEVVDTITLPEKPPVQNIYYVQTPAPSAFASLPTWWPLAAGAIALYMLTKK